MTPEQEDPYYVNKECSTQNIPQLSVIMRIKFPWVLLIHLDSSNKLDQTKLSKPEVTPLVLISRCSCENPYYFPAYFQNSVRDASWSNICQKHTNKCLDDRSRSQLYFKPKKVVEMWLLVVMVLEREGPRSKGFLASFWEHAPQTTRLMPG